ncbi:MAG TPA: hypothetical protein VGO60_11370 [Iamia sp.]|jgi:hypothetical protein|nr:hypothetical protein [Iamia sp.]
MWGMRVAVVIGACGLLLNGCGDDGDVARPGVEEGEVSDCPSLREILEADTEIGDRVSHGEPREEVYADLGPDLLSAFEDAADANPGLADDLDLLAEALAWQHRAIAGEDVADEMGEAVEASMAADGRIDTAVQDECAFGLNG